mgnify:FL=1
MKEKVNVTGVPETMVQTLYARAKETKKQNAKIKDEIAVELVEKLDYDFSKADKDKAMSCGVIARTIVLDRMVRQYLEKHENTVVINIACGLDTRCYRMHRLHLLNLPGYSIGPQSVCLFLPDASSHRFRQMYHVR